jgi:hypothetical protein
MFTENRTALHYYRYGISQKSAKNTAGGIFKVFDWRYLPSSATYIGISVGTPFSSKITSWFSKCL